MSEYEGPDIRAGGDLEGTGRHGGWTEWADIRGALTGAVPMPELFARTDGRFTFYPSKVNALLGFSETGKSLVVQAAAVEQIAAGERVVYLDHESDAVSVVSRLVSLGADTDDLEARLFYTNPEGALAGEERDAFLEILDGLAPTLIVVDGLTAAMESQGLEVNSNRDAATIFRTYLRPMCACGAAVVLIHHLPKGGGSGGHGLGAATLKNLVRGLQLEIADGGSHTPGKGGHSHLKISKDSDGGVRMFSNGNRWATFETSSTATGEEDAYGRPLFRTEWSLKAPGEDRPDGLATHCMAAISNYIEHAEGPVSKREIEDTDDLGAGYKRKTRRDALTALEAGGYIIRTKADKGKSAGYSHVKSYEDPIPGGSQPI